MDEGKVLKFTELSDPQHHANEQYGGADNAVLDFIIERERAMEKARAIEKEMEPKHTDAHITEAEVRPDVIESNKHYAKGALHREIINSYYNHPLVLADFKAGRAASMPPGKARGPALLIGSGPTLDKAHDLIRGWQGAIFCSTSQCVTMAGLDKKNFFILNVDCKTETGEYMPLWLWEDRDCISVTHPCVDPATIQAWLWKKLYFRIMVQQMLFYSQVLPLAYPMIRTQLYVYGCNASALVSCAALMGYNPIFLIGCDFGFPGNQDRFRALVPEKKAGGKVEWTQVPPHEPVFARHAKVTYRNGEITDSFQAYYKQTIFNVWRLCEADLFVVGDEGGLYELPHISREDLSASQGQGLQIRYLSNASKQDICDRYLLQYGTYTVDLPNGQVEFVILPHGDKDWKDDSGKVHNDLADMIESVNKQIAAAQAPGVLLLGEVKDRLNYLRDDEAWARKEQRWGWAIKSSASPTVTPSEPPLVSE